LNKLPEKSRELVHLYYYNDISTPEIADQLAMKADTVCRALSRVREKLRECIQRSIQTGGPAHA
jgi:RNA polymerase sigma-70 factor (ECF subfamily)